MSYTVETKLAIEAVRRAAELCVAVQADLINVASLEKKDRSPVTIADFGAQALVCQYLKEHFPQDSIVGEEDSADLQKPENKDKLSQVTRYVQQFHPQATPDLVCQWIDAGNGAIAERFWTLDPIDGTKGFLRKEQYALALALIEAGQVQVAVLACPMMPLDMNAPTGAKGVIFMAVRGQGSTMAMLNKGQFVGKFNPIQVEKTGHKNKLRLVESVETAHGNHHLQETLAQLIGITADPLRIDSQAKYGAVARGDAVLYLRLLSDKTPNYRHKIWDHAAGALIVEEAGGCVTDTSGQPLDFASSSKIPQSLGIVVSNGLLHQAVLDALSSS